MSGSKFKPWNSPHLLTHQFQLYAKFIAALNANVPHEKLEDEKEIFKKLHLKIIDAFSHQMMPSWLALAKTYYPYYAETEEDRLLIEALEQKLNIHTADYESLAILIKEVLLAPYPRVNIEYQPLINNIETVMAKLTAVALSTPSLINDAHARDKKEYEEAGPSMSSCIGPIETILNHLMGRVEINKSVVMTASSLLLQVKAIKSHFELIDLIQKLDNTKIENNKLRQKLESGKDGPEDLGLDGEVREEELDTTNLTATADTDLQAWQSKEEQIALIKVFRLQKN
jgi:hypothetical protein